RNDQIDREHRDRLLLPSGFSEWFSGWFAGRLVGRTTRRTAGSATDLRRTGRRARRGLLVQTGTLHAEPAHAMAQRIAADAEKPRGANHVAAGAGKRRTDACGLLPVAFPTLRLRRRRRRPRQGNAQPLARGTADLVVGTEQRDPLQQVAELAYVARPRIREQPRPRAVVETLRGHLVRGCVLGQEVLGERDHVRTALAQRGHVQDDQGEAM